MAGAEIALELERRKGSRPSPGTIYPVLKELKDKGLIECDQQKHYALTAKGKRELAHLLEIFFVIFSDIDEMKSCRRK